MHNAEAYPLRVRETGEFTKRCFLRRPCQACLKADHVIRSTCDILAPQLHDGVGWPVDTRSTAGGGIPKAHGFEWSKAQRVFASTRHLFNRQAAFKIWHLSAGEVELETVRLCFWTVNKIVHELQILLAVQWNIQVVVAALTVARGRKY